MTASAADAAGFGNPGPMARLEELTAPEVAAETMGLVVQRITDGETLKEIAKSLEVPYGKLAEWIAEDLTRAEMYARASRIWVDALARETVRIADDAPPVKGAAQVAKLQIETRRWLASKLNRGSYGEQMQISGKIENNSLSANSDAMLLELARGMGIMMRLAGQRLAQQQQASSSLPALPAPEREVSGTDTATDENPDKDPI